MVVSKRFADLPESDVACDGCGYILRGQTLGGICSECGLPIITSAARVADRATAAADSTGQHDAVRRSDLRWGPWLILAAGAIYAASFVVAPGRGISPYFFPLQLSGRFLAVAGVFVATRLSPGASEPPAVRVLRRVLRVVAALSLAGTLLQVITADGAGMFGTFRRHRYELAVAVGCFDILGTALLVLYGGGVAWLRRRFDIAATAFLVTAMLLVILAAKLLAAQINYSGRPDAATLLGLGDALVSIFAELRFAEYEYRFQVVGSVASIWQTIAAIGCTIAQHASAWGTILLLVQFALMARGEPKGTRPVPSPGMPGEG